MALVEEANQRRSRQIVGNVGMYYACFRLSQRGLNVMPTSRNARGVDLIAYGLSAMRFTAIQVKSLSSTKTAVPLGKNIDILQGTYWVIVAGVFDQPEAYIIKLEEVRERALQDRGKNAQWWLNRIDYEASEFKEKWERIEAELE